MKKIAWLIIMLILSASCVTRKACDRKFPVYAFDSVSTVTNTVTIIRDTTIYVKIPGDTVFQSVPVGEVSTLRTGNIKSIAWVKEGRLEHRLEQKSKIIETRITGAIKTKVKSVDNHYKSTVINNRKCHCKLFILMVIFTFIALILGSTRILKPKG